ncbi:hypothetical protein [Lebetimonas sp. JH369]|nr:hypothetical protein [Lebetimonas sp. JH369]
MKRVVVFFGKGGSNFLNSMKQENNYKIIAGITNRADSDALKVYLLF